MFCAADYGFDFDAFIFGPRRKRRRHMKWKMFERGDLKFVILRLISESPMHGYEVMKALEEESKGYYRPSPGSVYPTLQMLDDEGYVSVEEKDSKKIYSITTEGVAYLKENEDVVDDVFERVETFTDRFFGRDMKELSRSFSRLAQLTFDQAFQWGAEPEDIARMREILERAVDEMEAHRGKARAHTRGRRRERGGRGARGTARGSRTAGTDESED
jgi:DNA-binding PadR family transcriptional regulator